VNTEIFLPSLRPVTRWVSLEPHASLAAKARERGLTLANGAAVEVVVSDLLSLGAGYEHVKNFDSILYVDVLEHMQDDRGEIRRAVSLMRRDGKLIVLSPSHNFLFSIFDSCVGHFRRYDRESLCSLAPTNLELLSVRYLDSAAFFASLANKLFLKQDLPTAAQVRFWDSVLVRISKFTDLATAYRFGKSILAVWQLK